MSQAPPQAVEVDGRGLRFALVASRWNEDIVRPLIAGAQDALKERGAEVVVYRCAGAFEVAPLCARVLRAGGVDGVVALSCLIRGGTDHYALLAGEATRALGLLALEGATNPHAIAVSFGVLTCETREQAVERADPKRGAKGAEAALAALEQLAAYRVVDGGRRDRAQAGFSGGER